MTHFVREGGTLDRETEGVLRAWGEYVCRHWDEPDEGIWEPRTGRANHTHSRVLCWVALDRLLQLHAKDHVRWAPAAKFEENREAIRRQVETRAWNPALQSYVAELDGDRVDATLLLLAWYGFEAADSERMRQTYRRIRERLGAGDGLLYRYRSVRPALPEKEGSRLAGRGRVRHLQLLGRGVPGAGRRDGGGGAASCSSGSAATPTTWGSSPRRSIRPPAPRWATFPRRSPTSA